LDKPPVLTALGLVALNESSAEIAVKSLPILNDTPAFMKKCLIKPAEIAGFAVFCASGATD
jgi:hypothetical protein